MTKKDQSTQKSPKTFRSKIKQLLQNLARILNPKLQLSNILTLYERRRLRKILLLHFLLVLKLLLTPYLNLENVLDLFLLIVGHCHIPSTASVANGWLLNVPVLSNYR